VLLQAILGGKSRRLWTSWIGTVAQEFSPFIPPQYNVLSIWKSQSTFWSTHFVVTDVQILACEIGITANAIKAHVVLSMMIALSMSRACQPHSGALLLCMGVSDSIHRTCKSDVSAL
jgi:hypothetical protein